jgi:RNA polymerase sigma factor (sigma-70 family)
MKSAMASNPSSHAEGETPPAPDSWGGETDWSLIRKASSATPSFDKDRVWNDLLRRYEGPVRRLLDRHLRGDPEAAEATADFFSDLFQKPRILEQFDPGQGRFRCYIQGVVRRYALQWKRGNGAKGSIDMDGLEIPAEETDQIEADEEPVWAEAILKHALDRMRRTSEGDAELLIAYYGLFDRERQNGEDLGRERDQAMGTVHVRVHRARKKLEKALIEELTTMVASPEDLGQELEFLIGRLLEAHPHLKLDPKA